VVVARTAPPAAAAPFVARVPALSRDPGKPLDATALAALVQARRPFTPIRLVPPAQSGAPAAMPLARPGGFPGPASSQAPPRIQTPASAPQAMPHPPGRSSTVQTPPRPAPPHHRGATARGRPPPSPATGRGYESGCRSNCTVGDRARAPVAKPEAAQPESTKGAQRQEAQPKEEERRRTRNKGRPGSQPIQFAAAQGACSVRGALAGFKARFLLRPEQGRRLPDSLAAEQQYLPRICNSCVSAWSLEPTRDRCG
jgi:hypothetical protein